MKAAVVAFGLLSVVLLTLAVKEWLSRREDLAVDVGATERSNRRSGLILFAVCLAVFGSLLVTAAEAGWPRDRVLWIGVGAFLALMTLARPWWFWESWKARWLRNLIGDEATAAVYLAMAGIMVYVGVFTDWTFGRH